MALALLGAEIYNLAVLVIQNKLSGLFPTTQNSVSVSSEDINIPIAYLEEEKKIIRRVRLSPPQYCKGRWLGLEPTRLDTELP